MAKAEPKTRETEASVDEFIDKLTDPIQREDTRKVSAMMERISGEKAKMWGPAIIGFGSKALKYASGRELDWPRVAFSPRKGKISLYLTSLDVLADDLAKFGKHTTSKGCIYVKRLDDIDTKVLEKMIKKTLKAK
jgi:hypothetical protein